MKVRTRASKLQQVRSGVMELYISDHPLECLTCPANGHCELQDMAGAHGDRSLPARRCAIGHDGAAAIECKKDRSNPYFNFDPQQMHRLLALRARLRRDAGHVRADDRCGRGFASKVAGEPGRVFMDSECVSCGACVEACPTAALLREVAASRRGQAEHRR